MRIIYGDSVEGTTVEEGEVSELTGLDIPEGKCLFRLFVEKPKEAKIFINDIEQDSVIVDEFEVVHWKVTCEGYRPSIGEFQVINSIGFTLSLVPTKPKKIRNPYVKWSLNDKLGYNVEILDLSDQDPSDLPLPSPEGYDNSYLYAFGGNIYWNRIKLENIVPVHSYDSGKFLRFDSSRGFTFQHPIPPSPEGDRSYILTVQSNEMEWKENNTLPAFPTEQLGNKNLYTLNCKDGAAFWTMTPFKLPALPDEEYYHGDKYVLSCKNGEVSWTDGTLYWKDIKGDITEAPAVAEMIAVANEAKEIAQQSAAEVGEADQWINEIGNPSVEKINELNQWVENFGVDANGFVFEDGKIKYRDGFVFPDGEDIYNLHVAVDNLRNRYATFERYVIAQMQMRLTSPDYAQISDVEYRFDNFFFNSKKRYLHIECLQLGATLEVYRPIFDEASGSAQGPDLENGPILTLYKNVSGEGDVRLLELTTGFFYKVSSRDAFNLKYVGELPYGEYPG